MSRLHPEYCYCSDQPEKDKFRHRLFTLTVSFKPVDESWLKRTQKKIFREMSQRFCVDAMKVNRGQRRLVTKERKSHRFGIKAVKELTQNLTRKKAF